MLFFLFFLFLSHGFFLAKIFYNGVIQINIKPDLTHIKEDLALIEQYKLNHDKENKTGVFMIDHLNDNQSYNGFGIYKKKNNIYQTLHYDIAKNLLEKNSEGIEGIYVHYRGYSEKSDKMGRILLPRLDETDFLPIIITTSIDPLIIKGNIPDYFLISYDTPYIAYQASLINETKNNINGIKWIVERKDTIATDRKIPLNAIVIFADPSYIYFQKDGIFIEESLNIILPTLYVFEKEERNIFKYGSFALATMQYYKKLYNDTYTVEIENQTHIGSIIK